MKAPVLKTGRRASVSRVRIPPPPPIIPVYALFFIGLDFKLLEYIPFDLPLRCHGERSVPPAQSRSASACPEARHTLDLGRVVVLPPAIGESFALGLKPTAKC